MPDVTRLQPEGFASDLDEIAREGARRMLAQALDPGALARYELTPRDNPLPEPCW